MRAMELNVTDADRSFTGVVHNLHRGSPQLSLS